MSEPIGNTVDGITGRKLVTDGNLVRDHHERVSAVIKAWFFASGTGLAARNRQEQSREDLPPATKAGHGTCEDLPPAAIAVHGTRQDLLPAAIAIRGTRQVQPQNRHSGSRHSSRSAAKSPQRFAAPVKLCRKSPQRFAALVAPRKSTVASCRPSLDSPSPLPSDNPDSSER